MHWVKVGQSQTFHLTSIPTRSPITILLIQREILFKKPPQNKPKYVVENLLLALLSSKNLVSMALIIWHMLQGMQIAPLLLKSIDCTSPL